MRTSFDTKSFLTNNFDGVDGVVGLVGRHFDETPNREAVRKWFSRSAIPAEWWPVLLTTLEKEYDAPVRLDAYFGGDDDGRNIFA